MQRDPKGKKGRSPFVDNKALYDCIQKLFGVSTQAFVPSQKGQNGSYVGLGPSIGRGGNNDAIVVVNDVINYSKSQLTAIGNAALVAAGRPPNPSNQQVAGLTWPGAPFTNYTANDLGPMLTLQTQIHELGNSLNQITGAANNPNILKRGDPDAGAKLEDCLRKNNGFKSK